MKNNKPGIGISAAVMALSISVYAIGAFNSPVLDPDEAARRAYLKNITKNQSSGLNLEKSWAEEYWRKNPDVRADPVYGENGKLGVFGAREHYLKHGKREGREWPILP